MSSDDPVDLFSGTPLEERDARLRSGASDIANGGRADFFRRPEFLIWLSGTLMFLGLAAILLGWAGASRSIVLEEQVPYMISGGLLGVALAVIGAVTLLAQWVLVLIRENRMHDAARRREHAELLQAVQALREPAPTRRSRTR